MRSNLPVIIVIILCCSVMGATPAPEDSRRAQVSAATADALGSLERGVLAASVTPDLSVEQFVDRADSRDAVAKVLRRAEQVGGTRWLDEQTCQVRLELSGNDVADALVQIAQAKPKATTLPADVLSRRMEPLREMTFAATGMSTRAIERLRPPPEQMAWRGIPDEAVRAAITEARRNAARQVVQSVETIELPTPAPGSDRGNARLSHVLADQKVRDALEGWLMNQPITSADFQDDLEVRVGVAVDGESLWDQLVAVTDDRKEPLLPKDERVRADLRRKVLVRVQPTVGRAQAKAAAGGAPPRVPSDVVPREPPRWVTDQVDAKGSSRRVDGRLKTARAAENAARDRLRERVEELQLSRQLTLGEAAKRDPRVRTAIDRAVERARPRKVSYLSDGGAEVSFSLDLRDVWHELEGQ